jgi:hypothetical protein
MRQDPIILLGMHRSGTTLLSKIFSGFGIHMGSGNGRLNEANFFLDLNILLLEIYHAFWDYPLNMRYVISNNFNSNLHVVNELRRWINSFRFFKNYVGFRNYSCFYKRKTTAWGWKEPRTTVTWPLWFHVFKSPKFVFIYRNGIDVAESLRKAEKNSDKLLGGRNVSFRATTLEGAFKIWEEYNKVYYRFKQKMPSAKIIEVRYEDLLKDPLNKLNEIIDFIDIKINKEIMLQASQEIDSSRRYSFLKNDRLFKFYKIKKNNFWLNKFGYNNIEIE